MIKRKRIVALLTCIAILGSTNIAHAQTKDFSFTVKYGQTRNGTSAKKSDNEQIAYITATSFSGNKSQIAVGVKQVDGSADTGCWTFTKKNYKTKMKLGYEGHYASPNHKYKVYCEGFGTGQGTIKGRFTP